MNDRERLILKAIIKHYLEFGESVGSRTLEKKYEIGDLVEFKINYEGLLSLCTSKYVSKIII